MFYFQSFFVTRETNKEKKKKSDPSGTRTQDLSISIPRTLPTELHSFRSYCLNTIFQKPHFSKSHFSETPQEKYYHAIFLQPMSPKKCHKKFENRLTNKIIIPKNIFNRHFACARKVIQTP